MLRQVVNAVAAASIIASGFIWNLNICEFVILSSSTILSMELAQILSHISIGKFDFLGPMIKIDRKYT